MKLTELLREDHCRDFGNDPQCDADGLCICALNEQAAKRIERLEAALLNVPTILDAVLLNYHEAFGNEWRKQAHAIVKEARAALEEE